MATAVTSPKKILLINGPNLNLLGTREPAIYGSTTLPEVVSSAITQGKQHGIEVIPFQSNHEGAIIDFIHSHFIPILPSSQLQLQASSQSPTSRKERVAIVLNPAAFTHTSVAIRDALLATSVPFLEVHISNVHARESWRSHSYFSDKAVGVIMGLGVYGYRAALDFWANRWEREDEEEEREDVARREKEKAA